MPNHSEDGIKHICFLYFTPDLPGPKERPTPPYASSLHASTSKFIESGSGLQVQVNTILDLRFSEK